MNREKDMTTGLGIKATCSRVALACAALLNL